MTSITSRLGAERERRLFQVAALERAHGAMLSASQDSNADDEHDPEGATIAFERAQLAAQLVSAREAVADVDRALVRAEEGTYGICATCAGVISPARLEARPTADSCIRCASQGV